MRRWGLIGLASAMLTGLSLRIPRSKVTVWSGNLCGPGGGEPCPEPGVRAGWPMTMVTDSPDLSAIGSLWLEDDWSALGILLNLMFYAALVVAVVWLWQRWRINC